MTLSASAKRPSLARLVSLRIMVAAGLASLLQIAICLVENYSDDLYFAGSFVELETKRIHQSLRRDGQRIVLVPSSNMAHYSGAHAASYAFRVLDEAGNIIAASNAAIMQSVSPRAPPDQAPLALPDTWLRQLSPGDWFHIAGGKKAALAGQPLWIEVATFGDPANQRYYALWLDIVEDVWLPVLPTILLLAGFAILAVRISLRPLEQASLMAEQFDAAHIDQHFPSHNMPYEVARFCAAINRLLERVSRLITSQQLFISRAAHQLRTPLGIMLLELGKIPGARARRVENDVDLMTSTVNRMFKLARTDAIDPDDLNTIDPVCIAEDVIQQMMPLAQARSTAITLQQNSPRALVGDCAVVRDALANLVENAIKHTPPGTRITVICGPGSQLSVLDNGPGLPETDRDKLFEPFCRGATTADGAGLGLAIVKRAMELHCGSIEIADPPEGGTLIRLCFPRQCRWPPTGPEQGGAKARRSNPHARSGAVNGEISPCVRAVHRMFKT